MNTMETYVRWCELLGYVPSKAENILKYRKLCEDMNKPKWEIKAKFPSGKEKTYLLSKFPFKNLTEILCIAEEEDIYLQIFKVQREERIKLFDGLFLQLASEVENGLGA